MEKIVVYTANIGNYDSIKPPLSKREQGVEYYLITDNKDIESDYWNIIYVNSKDIDSDPQRVARYFKCNPHLILPKHDISVWVDSSFYIIINNHKKFVDLSLKTESIACYKHGSSNDFQICAYEEGRICQENNLDNSKLIEDQLYKYQKEGFPRDFGLFSTGVIVRRNNEKVTKFNEIWWNEIKNGSKRDQISQTYSLWKSNLGITKITLGKNIYNNHFFKKTKHLKK